MVEIALAIWIVCLGLGILSLLLAVAFCIWNEA